MKSLITRTISSGFASSKILVLSVLVFFYWSASAQVTFEKTIPGSHRQSGEDVIQTSYGGYAVIGTQWDFFNQWSMNHIILYNLDQSGNVLNLNLLNNGYDLSWGFSIEQTDDGLIGCGMGTGYSGDPYLMKFTAQGDTIWTRTYSQETGYSIATSVCQTYDHGYAICGTLAQMAMFVIRTNGSGEELWQKTFDDPSSENESAECIIETYDSSLVICGHRNDSLVLLKLSQNGDSIWMKYYNEKPSAGNSIKQTDDHGFIIAGWVRKEENSKDVLLLKTNEDGNVSWEKSYGGSEDDLAEDVELTVDDGFIMCGTTNSYGNGKSDVYLVKTDSEGDTLWTRTFGGDLDEEAHGMDCTLDGGYIISGYKYLNDTLQNIYLIKTDESGMLGIGEDQNIMPGKLVVYPNPASGVLSVKCLGLSEVGNLELIVYDIFGRPSTLPRLGEGQGGGNEGRDRGWQMDVSALPPGIYFISVLQDGKRVAGGKFVVAR
jgi:hypothetical protein